MEMEAIYFRPDIFALATPNNTRAPAETMHAAPNFNRLFSVKGFNTTYASNGVQPNPMKLTNVTNPFFHRLAPLSFFDLQVVACTWRNTEPPACHQRSQTKAIGERKQYLTKILCIDADAHQSHLKVK